MEAVVLVIHLILAVAIVALVLLQPSEGGMGSMAGGGNPFSGLTTSRGAANLLTRATAILVTLFILTSLGLAILAGRDNVDKSILDYAPDQAAAEQTMNDKSAGNGESTVADDIKNKADEQAADEEEPKPDIPISQ